MRKSLLIFLLPVLAAAGCDRASFPRSTSSSAASAGSKHIESEEDTYTVLLRVMSDPATHITDARYYEKALTEKLGWKDVFALHKDGHSEVYWGRYPTPAKARKGLEAAKAYRAKNGVAVFARAMIVPLPGKDIGPKEWNLTAAKGTHSVLVAIFRDDPAKNYYGRRRRAVEYCRRLREGGCEGYFWHGKVSSHVTIGTFTQRAFRVEPTDRGNRTVVVDPRVLQIQKDFPMLVINGWGENIITRDRRGQPRRTPRKTYLIRIPRDDKGDDGAAQDRVGLSQPG
ncbi:MAG: hypothetical protein ACYS5V_11110 [Planctomycetota bacterium]|jgi:hypothetical protein